MKNKKQCNYCKGKGYREVFPLDGCTIYSWMKPKKIKCSYCDGKEQTK